MAKKLEAKYNPDVAYLVDGATLNEIINAINEVRAWNNAQSRFLKIVRAEGKVTIDPYFPIVTVQTEICDGQSGTTSVSLLAYGKGTS